ncbi:MAG: outer membrane protein [Alphaproteobacteria bacterium]
MNKFAAAAIAACLTAIAAAPSALAADRPVIIPDVEPVPEPPSIFYGGWYLRGDIGYKIYQNPEGGWFDPVAPGPLTFQNTSLADTGVIGGGIGYKFNSWFRTDLTADYEFKAGFYGEFPCGGACGYSQEFSDISAWTFLANFYADLGHYGAFTPYVGAGIGASYVMVDGVNFINPDSSTGVWDSGNNWNFAWALMAGFGIDVAHNVTLDVNYRYLDLGEGRSGIIPIGGSTHPIVYDDLVAHEFRVGIRYMFGGGQSTPNRPVVASF